MRRGGAECKAGTGRLETLRDSGPLEGWGPTESGQGEEATCCFRSEYSSASFWLLVWLLRGDGDMHDGLSPDTSPVPLETKFSFLSDGQLGRVLWIGTESQQGRCGERRPQGRVQYYLLVGS